LGEGRGPLVVRSVKWPARARVVLLAATTTGVASPRIARSRVSRRD